MFLTDGVVNLALLRFKSDEAAQGTGKDFVGLHHVGFWVDEAIEAGKTAKANGAKWIMGDPTNKGGYEVKYTDPAGVIFDIAEDGWAGAQKSPGEADNMIHPNTRGRISRFDDRREKARRDAEARRVQETV